ncbi:hypothetical protein CTAYLR_008299 [Chrysophaeum taylorii]|uniref:P-type Ca(2+) transporter n=1 Tax=Chrysophaeum taylorii TaxID=2483200 RepID=A0AAD7XFA5_9STRA|nr:hypothetical protein CTAYLR_008299 [Chrysophaeum taylorii]
MGGPIESPWAYSSEALVAAYATSLSKGLTTAQAEAQSKVYGANELAKEEPTALWQLVLEQFDDVLVKVLLLAAAVSFLLALTDGGEEGFEAFVEPAVIMLILVLNAIVGVWQESNAEHALEALKEMQSEHAKTLRDGVLEPQLPASELVPGDVVSLAAGDRVPADMRVAVSYTATVRAQQASLTGESDAVSKRPDVTVDEDAEIQAKECMLFSGTAVASGSCVGVVTSIGMQTEMGKIHGAISEAAQEADDTPLKKKLDEFGVLLTQMIGVICVLVWLINYSHFITITTEPRFSVEFSFARCTYYFKIAVALAVAAIPEGLPTVITTCLALGTRKMVKQNAIVRKLPSVETLGCTTVICSDKTGTLTTNQMSCVRVAVAGEDGGSPLRTITLSGTSYDPADGSVVEGKDVASASHDGLDELATGCAVCNEADLQFDQDARRVRATGAPTEAALLPLVEKLAVAAASSRAASSIKTTTMTTDNDYPVAATSARRSRVARLAILEFDRDRKSMSALVREVATGSNTLYAKGAPESIIDRCDSVLVQSGAVEPLSPETRARWTSAAAGMSSEALRVLAFAVKKGEGLGPLATYSSTNGGATPEARSLLEDPKKYAEVESGMVLVGLCGLLDPPRPEVPAAIAACRAAGIRVIVITGDNKLTAEAICSEIGVLDGDFDKAKHSITGRDFAALSKEDQKAFLLSSDLSGRVFSRAEPRHKQDIVRLLKESGEVAAMTGDGVNDAPALKLADIGIAMGITGTEVAKEASDMVLADDNFSSIVAAVAEGRSIYNNMKAFIRYMISSNVGEVASIFLTAALGMPEGLVPVQLLWVNLVTDGPPATALGFNPPDNDNMVKPPRRADDALLTPWIVFRYFVVGAYVGLATVGIFAVWYTRHSFLGINLAGDGHSIVDYHQLTTWGECHKWENFTVSLSYSTQGGGFVEFDQPCDYFTKGKVKASTLSLSVLVSIEMFNALNALSEDCSLLTQPPWVNPYLLIAMCLSFGLHFLILYVPILAETFSIVPLTFSEWLLVFVFSFAVVIIDEILKFVGRTFITQKVVDRKHLDQNKKKNV